MRKSKKESHFTKVHARIFATERNTIVTANLLYEPVKTRMDGGEEEENHLSMPDVSNSDRGSRQQKLHL